MPGAKWEDSFSRQIIIEGLLPEVSPCVGTRLACEGMVMLWMNNCALSGEVEPE